MELEEFSRIVSRKGSTKGKKFDVTNTRGTKEAWRWLKKNKWFGITPVSEHDFGKIVKTINLALMDRFLKGYPIRLPANMGRLELTKQEIDFNYSSSNALKPVNWKDTVRMWYENEDWFRDKKLVFFDHRYFYWIRYNKRPSNYKNSIYYKFSPARAFGTKVTKSSANKLIDTWYEVRKYKDYNDETDEASASSGS